MPTTNNVIHINDYLKKKNEEKFDTAYAWQLAVRLSSEDGTSKEAEELYRKIMDREPNNPRVCLNLGNIHFERGELDLAMLSWLNALDIDEDLTHANYNMGIAKLTLGLPDEAANYLEKTIRLDSSYHEAYFYLGQSLFMLKQFSRALNAYETYLNLEPNTPTAEYAKKMVAAISGKQG